MKKLLLACLTAASLTASAPAQLLGYQALLDKLEALGAGNIDAKNFNYNPADGNVTIDGPLHIRTDEMEVFAGKAEYIGSTEQLRFMGNVAIYKDGLIYRGDKATYNTNSNQLDCSDMRSSIEPLFFKAGSLSTTTKEITVIESEDTEFTTEDSQDPGFYIKSDKVTIYPGERVIFRKMKAYVGDTPIFYLPYLSQPLEAEMGYTFVPGYRSNLGAFLLNQYGVPIGDHSVIKYKFDLYSARGVGTGFDIESRKYRSDENFGKFKFYWVYDNDPEKNNTFSKISRLGNVDSSRYRVNLQHRIYLPGPEESDLYLDVDINKISDEFFYEDFSPGEFREDPQPDNIINLVKRSERGEINLMARLRANDFYQTDTRSPEFAWDAARQPIFDTGLFYAGTTSFGILKETPGNDDSDRLRDRINSLDEQLTDPLLAIGLDPGETNATLTDLRAQLVESEFTRFHTYHEVLFPKTISGAFNVIPRAGVGYTNYSGISGPKPLSSGRALLTAGLDTSFKMSKIYNDVVKPSLGLDGLKHVVQPYLSWSFVSADSQGDAFRGIDRLALSTRPRALDVANYTAIDRLRDWNIVRLGVSNRLQTRRNNGTYNWLTSNTYIDAFIDDPELNRSVSNLYQDIEWRPLPWSKLNLGAQIPVGGNEAFTEINTRLTIMPTDYLDLVVGHRLLKNHPFFRDSNLIDFGAYAKIGEDWGISIYERFEIEDSTLETQQYSVHKDLNSWVGSVGAIIRENRGEADWGILFSMTLKDFPSVRVPIDFDPQGGRR